MSRPPYPHRRLDPPKYWAITSCQCDAVSPTFGVETWGSDCPIALRERITDLEAAARADQSLRSVAAHAAGMQPVSADDPEWPPRWEAIASVRIAEAEAERDAARGLLESLPTWGTYGWREAADSVRAKLAENAKQIVDLVHERDEMRRELADLRTLGASIHKTVAAALEARAGEIEEAADEYADADNPGDEGHCEGLRLAARIVRGTP